MAEVSREKAGMIEDSITATIELSDFDILPWKPAAELIEGRPKLTYAPASGKMEVFW